MDLEGTSWRWRCDGEWIPTPNQSASLVRGFLQIYSNLGISKTELSVSLGSCRTRQPVKLQKAHYNCAFSVLAVCPKDYTAYASLSPQMVTNIISFGMPQLNLNHNELARQIYKKKIIIIAKIPWIALVCLHNALEYCYNMPIQKNCCPNIILFNSNINSSNKCLFLSPFARITVEKAYPTIVRFLPLWRTAIDCEKINREEWHHTHHINKYQLKNFLITEQGCTLGQLVHCG